MTCVTCRDLLSQGLNLCVRAREMDARDRREKTLSISQDAEAWQEGGRFDRYVERHNAMFPHTPISLRSGTPQLWQQEQYDKDLLAWEDKSRAHLQQGCAALNVVK